MRTDTPITQEYVKELNKLLDDALVQCGHKIIMKWNENPIKIVPWKYIYMKPKFIPTICQVYVENDPRLTKWKKIKRWVQKMWRRMKL